MRSGSEEEANRTVDKVLIMLYWSILPELNADISGQIYNRRRNQGLIRHKLMTKEEVKTFFLLINS